MKNPSCLDETAGRIRIEVIAGDPAFNFTLTEANERISAHEWRQKVDSVEQRDLVGGQYTFTLRDGSRSSERSITATEHGVYRVFVTKEKDGCVFTDDVAITGAETQTVAVYPTVLTSNENYNISISMEEPAEVLVKVYNAKGIILDEMHGTDNSEQATTYQIVRSCSETHRL